MTEPVPADLQQHAPNPPGGAKAKRRMKNFALQPLVQVKLGIYAIVLSVLFAAALAAIIYHNFYGLYNSIILLTDAEDEVRELIGDYWRGTQLWVGMCIGIYLLATIFVSVMYTHKLVGPTIAFRRHIRSIADGKYNARTYLRRGDAFLEVADELNRLSEIMEKTKGAPHHAGKS
jgi:hypothetical protein